MKKMTATVPAQPAEYLDTRHIDFRNERRELMRTILACVSTRKRGVYPVVTVRWYMGRSASAMTVYCNVFSDTFSASGSAGGGGYDKYSASLANALRNAGVTLSRDISGCGDSASRDAIEAIARASGYRHVTVFQP